MVQDGGGMENINSLKLSPGMGGYNYSKNIDKLDPSCMIEESCNFNILPDYLQTRGGTQKVLSLSERQPITSLYQINDKNSINIHLLLTTFNGKIYKDDSEILDLSGSINKASYISWNDHIVINTGSTKPYVFDISASTISVYPTDNLANDWITFSSYPSVMILHGRGLSSRAWALGTPHNPNTLYYSDVNNGISTCPNFQQTGSGFFVINTPNNEPLTSMISFGDRLIVFSKTKSFIIDDSSLDIAEWGYTSAQWKGGCLNQELILQTENDLFAFSEDGTIYSVSAVMQYGDYRISSITEAAQINTYIQEKINNSLLLSAHAQFDPTLRAIKYFMAFSNYNLNNMALVYFIDKQPMNGWSIHHNINFDSGYDACSSCLIKNKTNNNSFVYTGDYDGNVWLLETDNINDAYEEFPLILTSPFINVDDPRNTKRFKRGYLEIIADNSLNIKINQLSSSYNGSNENLVFISSQNTFDDATWDFSTFDISAIKYIKYFINKIGIYIKQSFSFSKLNVYQFGRFDSAKWDQDRFVTDDIGISKFNILSNIIDVITVSNRSLMR